MNRNNGILILSLWALLLAPVLCGVGVLAHYCVCDDSRECSHELSCSTDPCEVLAVGLRSDDTHQDIVAATVVDSGPGTGVLRLVVFTPGRCVEAAPFLILVPLFSAFADDALPLLC